MCFRLRVIQSSSKIWLNRAIKSLSENLTDPCILQVLHEKFKDECGLKNLVKVIKYGHGRRKSGSGGGASY